MIKTKNIKRLLLTCALSCVMAAGTGATCFAADIQVQNNNSATVPVYMEKGAQSFDFSVTERIDMTGEANSTDLECTDLTLTNNVATGHINYDLELKGEGEWSHVRTKDISFKDLTVNTKLFGLVADGEHDMADIYEHVHDTGPGKSNTTTFTGQVGTQTSPVNKQVGKVIATVNWM